MIDIISENTTIIIQLAAIFIAAFLYPLITVPLWLLFEDHIAKARPSIGTPVAFIFILPALVGFLLWEDEYQQLLPNRTWNWIQKLMENSVDDYDTTTPSGTRCPNCGTRHPIEDYDTELVGYLRRQRCPHCNAIVNVHKKTLTNRGEYT